MKKKRGFLTAVKDRLKGAVSKGKQENPPVKAAVKVAKPKPQKKAPAKSTVRKAAARTARAIDQIPKARGSMTLIPDVNSSALVGAKRATPAPGEVFRRQQVGQTVNLGAVRSPGIFTANSSGFSSGAPAPVNSSALYSRGRGPDTRAAFRNSNTMTGGRANMMSVNRANLLQVRQPRGRW